ncbi:MAG: Fis family transcriptional regulator [Gammaproteobacteria bacterium]|nr:Fis family transcriptional regulator [Gammaproteobacteria bacterium]MCD8541905.1 Fis family transcriptional regulator [Gammaproteobacteria bacterium]
MSAIFEPSVVVPEKIKPENYSLSQHIKDLFQHYIVSLNGEVPHNLYELFLSEFEKPFFEAILSYTRHNQSKAAALLGMSRGTLRKKLKECDLL